MITRFLEVVKIGWKKLNNGPYGIVPSLSSRVIEEKSDDVKLDMT